MLIKGTIAAQMSGSLGGITASHNAGGTYFRARVTPTNPNTLFQQAVRAAVALLSSIWQTTLSQLQRDAWKVYADNVTVTNRIGDQINISGLAMYIRSNVTRLQFNLARIDDAPAIFNLGGFTPPIFNTASAATQTINVIFRVLPGSDAWANEAGGFMFLFWSRPQNSGINFFRGPYRAVGSITGDPVPPVSPATFPVPFLITEGQRVFTRATVASADGRYSTDVFSSVLVEA